MAREDIQINTVAPQANIVAPADTYSRPYYDRNAGSGFMELAKSLGILGDTIAHKQKEAANSQGQADYEHYGALAAEFGDPSAKNASLITTAKDGLIGLFSTGKGSATVRNKVEEVQGDTQASTDFFAEGGYGSRLMPFANDPAALQAEIKKIRAEAYAKVKGRPAYGNNYIKQLDTYFTGFQGKTFENQQANYKFKEEQSIAAGAVGAATPDANPDVNLHDHVDGASNSLISYLTKGKPGTYISDLQPEFSSRIQKMIAAAPPEIRSRIRIDSGARTPARQAELIKAQLSGASLAGFTSLVAKLGPEKGAAQWATMFPEAAKARGIGHSIALPGRSLHQHGFAIDFARDPVAEAWMHKNAGNFGLYYPMGHEPWHIEQIGARGRSGPRTISGESQGELPSVGPFLPDKPNIGYKGWDNSPNFFDNYYKVVTGTENNTGDPTAKNPLSSAAGRTQFIESTWLEQYGKVYGDTGQSREEILALRSDDKVSRIITIAYAKENAKALEGYAVPVNTTTLLMAHQLGAKGAAAVLQAFKADASQPIDNVLDDDVMAANPQYHGKTVAQVYNAAASKTGEFTNPVGGAKERTSTAYHEGIATSTLGPEAFNKTFAMSIIDQATATQNTALLDSMPDEIMAQPAYADKVRAARESIASNQRTEFTFRQAQAEKADKAFTETVLGEFASKILEDPKAEIPLEVKQRIAKLPGGGFEVLNKLTEMRKALLAPTPESKRADTIARSEATDVLEQFKLGNATEQQAKDAALKINDPELLNSALQDVAKYKFVPMATTDPGVKEMKNMFLQSKYKYIENTTIPDPMAAANGLMAATLYNRYLAVELAKLGHKATDIELYEDKGIIQRVQERVLSEVDLPPIEGAGNLTPKGAGEGDPPPPPPPPPPPAVVPTGVIKDPEDIARFNKYAPSRKNVPQR